MLRIHNRMLRARIMKLREDKDCAKEEQAAFQLLRDGLLGVMNERKVIPHSTFIPIRLYGAAALYALMWQEDGRTLLPTLFIQEEALSILPSN